MKSIIAIFILIYCNQTLATDDRIEQFENTRTEELFQALGLQKSAAENLKEKQTNAPVHAYKLALSRILMAWELSGNDETKKIQIEEQSCSLIRKAAEEGFHVAAVTQLSLCDSLLEVELTREKRDNAVQLLFRSLKKKDQWIEHYPIQIYSHQARCFKTDINKRIAAQTYEQVMAEAYELAYRFESDPKQKNIYLRKALELNCETLRSENIGAEGA